ncbi:MAG: hypothetical protein HRT93_05015 [Piscirickettsiaceae bacterium]|nr:hypothetical protein [Piscirickettsiaceae bacterium]
MKALDQLRPFNNKELRSHFIQWKWFAVALVVGSALNLINQWDAVFGASSLDYLKLTLTYSVPYLVASISAWLANAT